MKYLLAAVLSLGLITTSQTQAKADGGIILGILGGVILGEVLNTPHYQHHQRHQQHQRRAFTQVCELRPTGVYEYNPYTDSWHQQVAKICEWR